MLSLCIFASHWLVSEPAAFEGPLTGVLIRVACSYAVGK